MVYLLNITMNLGYDDSVTHWPALIVSCIPTLQHVMVNLLNIAVNLGNDGAGFHDLLPNVGNVSTCACWRWK